MFFISYTGLANSKSSIYVKRLFQLLRTVNFTLFHDQENIPAKSEESTETVFDNQVIRLGVFLSGYLQLFQKLPL